MLLIFVKEIHQMVILDKLANNITSAICLFEVFGQKVHVQNCRGPIQ